MSGESQDYQTGQIIEKLSSLEKSRNDQFSNLHQCVDNLERKFEAFTAGLGQRVEKQGERITILETAKPQTHEGRILTLEQSVSLLNKVAWLLFASSMGVVVAAFWKMVIR